MGGRGGMGAPVLSIRRILLLCRALHWINVNSPPPPAGDFDRICATNDVAGGPLGYSRVFTVNHNSFGTPSTPTTTTVSRGKDVAAAATAAETTRNQLIICSSGRYQTAPIRKGG